MNHSLHRRGPSFAVVALTYALALAAAAPVYRLAAPLGMLPATLMADIAATLAVWVMSCLFNNASLYDPYWSVAPLFIVGFWLAARGVSAASVLMAAAVFFWGLRLTANWARGWRGLSHQDWRYSFYQRRFPRLWLLINLGGIQLMPTVLVFGGLTGAWRVVEANSPPTALFLLGLAVSVGAAALQLTADRQLRAFRADPSHRGACIDRGLWRNSRHPNYLGEVLFWWGVAIMGLGQGGLGWFVLGPVLITGLFVFISIPMMETHLMAGHREYGAYRRRVPMLVPLPITRREGEDTLKEEGRS